MKKGNSSQHGRSLPRLGSGRGRRGSTRTSQRPLLERLEERAMLAGWTTLSASGSGPSAGQTMQLLSNGTVMVESASPQVNQNWYALTPGQTGNSFPDNGQPTGNYANGSWSSLASMNEGRAFFPAAVLPNGEDYVLGGEYSSPDPFTNTAETYNPDTNTWSSVASAPTPATNVGLNAKITGASNTSPITITTTNTGVLSAGEQVTISGVGGNTAANGTFTISNITGTSFDLNGTTGNGAYTSGGSWSAFKSQYGDDPIEVLGNGDVLAGYFNSPTTYLYNPTTNTWTTTANTKLHNDRSDEETWLKLADGSILSYDIYASSSGTFQAQRYVPSTGLWTDASGIDGANPPSILSDPGSAPNGGEGAELGPAFLLPNGNAIFFGANGNTAIYNPTTNQWSAGPAEPSKNFSGSITGASNAGPITITTGSTAGLQNGEAVTISGVGGNTAANGTWVITNLTGTSFQLLNSNGNGAYTSGGTWSVGQLVMADAPGAMMPNGDILLVMSPLGGIGANGNYTFPKTAYAYEFNPTTGVYTEVTPSGGLPSNSNFYYMVNLPSGQILMDGNDGFAGVYTPAAGPQDSWRPVITGIQNNNDGTFTLHGTQLTGISEGSSFGDDYESATNYPIVQLTDFAGNVYYAKTYNWSTTNVQTGSTPETATFTLPAGKSISDFATATVVSNGIESQAANLLDLDSSDENLIIRVNPTDSNDIQVLIDGTQDVIADYPNNSANPINVFGDGNNNRLVIDEEYGKVNVPINFDGGGSPGAPGDQMLVTGSSGNDQLVLTPQTPTSSTMSFNGSALYSFTNIQQFSFWGTGGNDNLTIDTSQSLSSTPIFYDGDNSFSESDEVFLGGGVQSASQAGGNGFNTLTLMQTGGSAQTSDVYSVGPNNGEGSDVITGGGVTQSVQFENLAPVIDTVPAATQTVNATPSSNAINYTVGPNSGSVSPPISGAATGQITIDNQESIEFANKANLTINSEAGNDSINIANTTVPTGLTSITVNGNDPGGTGGTSGDNLIFTGTDEANQFVYLPASSSSGAVNWVAGSTVLPSVTFNTVEGLTIDGGATLSNDSLTVRTPDASDVLTLTPGAQFDSGTITDSGTASPTNFTPLTFLNLGQGGSVNLVDNALGHAGTLDYLGTNSSDVFSVDSSGSVHLNNQILVTTQNIANLVLSGLSGDDQFALTGPSPFTSVTLDGGDPSASDIATLTGATGPVTVNLANSSAIPPTNTSITGYGGTVNLTGVEGVNLNANSQPLTFVGTSPTNTITYTPTGAAAGTVTAAGVNTTFNFTGVAGGFTINAAAAGANQVIVNGTPLNDQVLVDEPSRTVTVNALQSVTLGANIASLSLSGLAGDDTFTVNPAPTPNGLPVNIDGGDPEASDALIVNATAANQFTVVNQGRSPNSGTVRVYEIAVADPDISYKNVEIVDPNTFIPPGSLNAPNLLVLGPDNYEANNYLNNASFLGSGSTLQIQHASIFPNASENGNNPGLPADQDFYQVVAQTTGTLDFQVYFNLFSTTLLPGGGNLSVRVYDAAGQLLGSSTGAFGADSTLASPAPTGARVRIPVVAGQSYYLRVTGGLNADGSINAAIVNGYNATIIDTPAPVPYDVELSRSVAAGIAGSPDTGDLPPNAPADDTGRSQFDNVTNVNTPTIYVRVADGILLNDLPGNGTPDNPPVGEIPIPFSNTSQTTPGYNVAIFDGNNTQTPVGYATQVPGFPGLYTYTFTTPLVDGVHNIVAAVEMVDPQNPEETGFGVYSTSLAITIDTVAPPVQFGITSASGTTTGLDGASDSGALGATDSFTLSDKITNVKEPTFYGTAEANAIVKLYAIDKFGNPLLLGQTTATPLDGTNADPNGQWTITSTVDLNDPNFFNYDGVRHLYVTAEDLAGNVNNNGAGPGPNAQQIVIFLDTQGPQIAGVNITNDPNYNLWGIKAQIGTNQGDAQANQGPTPLVYSLTIQVTDNPNRDPADFPNDPAILADIASTPGQYELVGDANGIIAISQIIVTNNPIVAGQPATATVQLVFAQPLPDDRYTLTIKDTGLIDPAGNDLDGESNADEPNGGPTFPSGDGQPGGNFVGRFTVDSRPELGTYAASTAWIDINGNMVWDPNNTDATNRDLIFSLGLNAAIQGQFSPFGIHNALTSGDYLNAYTIGVNAGPPSATPLPGQQKIGYDKLAAYGYDPLANGGKGGFRWLIDTNSDGVINTSPYNPVTNPTGGDYAFAMAAGSQINGVPVSGDFALDPAAGDQIGLFTGTTWYLDTSTDLTSFANAAAPGGSLQFSTPFLAGSPVVGDFNGAVTPSGAQIPDLATYQNGVFHIVFGQYNPITNSVFYVADAAHEDTVNFSFAGVGGIPVAADMNQDGITDLGVYEPPTTGTTPQTGTWYWLVSNAAANPNNLPNASALNHPFSPAPLGNDIFADFGQQSALPIVGNFDPPVTPAAGPAATALGVLPNTDAVTGQSVSGTSWYSFTPQNSGTMTITASGGSSSVELALYDANQNLIASGNTQVINAVSSGTQYLVRVTGSATGITLNFSNSVSTAASYAPLDVNHDGVVSPLDALAIINDLNQFGTHPLAATANNPESPYDVNGDGIISPLDALAIINDLNAVALAAAQGSSAQGSSAAVAAVAAPAVASAGSGSSSSASAASPAIATSGSGPVSAGVATNVLAIDAVFAGLASSSDSTSSNLQSKAGTSTLASTTPVRKTSLAAGTGE